MKKEFLKKYFQKYQDLINLCLEDEDKIIKLSEMIHNLKIKNNKLLIFGNGGSSAIASHFGADIFKVHNIRYITNPDISLLTCLSNDFSYQEVIKITIEQNISKDDLVILISSSGSSKNVNIAADLIINKKYNLVTLTGMSNDNNLIKKNKDGLNFYVDSNCYNIIENVHQFILLTALDLSVQDKIHL